MDVLQTRGFSFSIREPEIEVIIKIPSNRKFVDRILASWVKRQHRMKNAANKVTPRRVTESWL